MFDVRELISAVRRGLQNGDYAEPVATDFSIRDVDMLGSDTLSPRFMATSDECVYALMNGLQDEDVSVRIESVSALGGKPIVHVYFLFESDRYAFMV